MAGVYLCVSKRRMNLPPSLVVKPHRGVGERGELVAEARRRRLERRHEARARRPRRRAPRLRLRLGGELPLELGVARERQGSARSSPALPTGAASAFAAAADAASDAAARPPPPPRPRAAASAAPRAKRAAPRPRRRRRSPRRAAPELRAHRRDHRPQRVARALRRLRVIVVAPAPPLRAPPRAPLPPPRNADGGARRAPRLAAHEGLDRALAPPRRLRTRLRRLRWRCAPQRRHLSLDAAERLRHHAPVALKVARLGARRAQLLAHARTLLARRGKVRARGGELPLLLRLGILHRQVLAPRLSSAASLNCV